MTTPPPALNWGILGCARITRRGLIPGIQNSSGSRLTALGSRDGATAKKWADEFGFTSSYGSYEEVIADPAVQAIYIPLPNELHRRWVEAAADAGKHVLCEKPLALDADQATAMAEYCRSRNVLLMEAFMWRHQPRMAALRTMVAEGAEIGKLRLIRASFSFAMDGDDWRLDPQRGGGSLWDVGCYGVNTARLFAGSEPTRIRASAHVGPTGVDLSMAIALEFPDGVLAAIDCSFEQQFRCNFEIVGDRGSIEVPDAYLPPEQPTLVVRSTGTDSANSLADAAPRTLTFDGRNQYAGMVDIFAESVTQGALVATAENGVAQMKVLSAILQDLRS